MVNLSSSSGSTLPRNHAPNKKQKLTPAELALMSSTPAVPAVVVPFSVQNVELHRAAQIHTSSASSKISVVSSNERLRRHDLARAKRQLAQALVTAYAARVYQVQAVSEVDDRFDAVSILCLQCGL